MGSIGRKGGVRGGGKIKKIKTLLNSFFLTVNQTKSNIY